jgi:hypothetical protein
MPWRGVRSRGDPPRRHLCGAFPPLSLDSPEECGMFVTYLRRELRRRMRQAVFIALGLALGVGLVITVTAASAGVKNAQGTVLHALYGVGTDVTVTKTPKAGSFTPGSFGFGFRTGTRRPRTRPPAPRRSRTRPPAPAHRVRRRAARPRPRGADRHPLLPRLTHLPHSPRARIPLAIRARAATRPRAHLRTSSIQQHHHLRSMAIPWAGNQPSRDRAWPRGGAGRPGPRGPG